MNVLEKAFMDELIELQERHNYYLRVNPGDWDRGIEPSMVITRISPEHYIECHVIDMNGFYFDEREAK